MRLMRCLYDARLLAFLFFYDWSVSVIAAFDTGCLV